MEVPCVQKRESGLVATDKPWMTSRLGKERRESLQREMGTARGHQWCWSSHIVQEVEEVEETCSHGEDPFISQIVGLCISSSQIMALWGWGCKFECQSSTG